MLFRADDFQRTRWVGDGSQRKRGCEQNEGVLVHDLRSHGAMCHRALEGEALALELNGSLRMQERNIVRLLVLGLLPGSGSWAG